MELTHVHLSFVFLYPKGDDDRSVRVTNDLEYLLLIYNNEQPH